MLAFVLFQPTQLMTQIILSPTLILEIKAPPQTQTSAAEAKKSIRNFGNILLPQQISLTSVRKRPGKHLGTLSRNNAVSLSHGRGDGATGRRGNGATGSRLYRAELKVEGLEYKFLYSLQPIIGKEPQSSRFC